MFTMQNLTVITVSNGCCCATVSIFELMQAVMIRKPLQKTEFKNLLSFRQKSKNSEKTVKTVTNFENADDENDQ